MGTVTHDWLLRLSQQLREGGVQDWQKQLVVWLEPARRTCLRGVMFSQSQRAKQDRKPHGLSDSQLWQGIASDRMKGHRTGLPWQQMLAWSLMVVMLMWGTGSLASFLLNRNQIIEIAERARALEATRTVSDKQLMNLHALRNDLGRQQHWLAQGVPWYQRFGLDHTRKLYDALLPRYGLTAGRMIHAPARAALEGKLTRLAGLPTASPLRATLARPGYNQLKA